LTALGPLLILLVLGVIVVIAAARLRFPYTAALVLLGIVIGIVTVQVPFFGIRAAARSLFSPTLFFDLLLPPIVFEAAIHINFRLFRHRTPLILFLVFVGVLFTTAFTGLVVSWLVGLPLLLAFLLAAILSPTDPIAVVEMFRRLRVPSELATIVESESLLNDAVGVVTFVVVLGLIGAGTFDPVTTGLSFAWMVLGGIGVGLAAAGGVYVLHRRLHDPAVETALSIVAAYGSFLLATDVGASGIIATTIAGIGVGTVVAPRAMSPEVRHSLETFWNVVVYVVNSVIFLAMGLLLSVSDLVANLPLIVLVFLILYAGRTVFVYLHRPLSVALVGRSARLPGSWYNVLALTGIRGVIPIVLALSLYTTQDGISDAVLNRIVAVVIGVAVLSVVAGNLVADWYVTRTFGSSADPG
jgi:Na+:H+ antiporter